MHNKRARSFLPCGPCENQFQMPYLTYWISIVSTLNPYCCMNFS